MFHARARAPQALVEQWVERLSEFLGIPSKTIGKIGGGRRRATGGIDVAIVQTLARGETDDFARGYGHVVIDECHHVPAVSIERVLAAIPTRYITGLTATPYRHRSRLRQSDGEPLALVERVGGGCLTIALSNRQ